MPPYQHISHAGNHADVLKHALLTVVLNDMAQRHKQFVYLETHAGAGMYDLLSQGARIKRQYQTGVMRLWHCHRIPEPLHPYMQILRRLNQSGELTYYPGSPWLANCFMRNDDRAILFETSAQPFQHLSQLFQDDCRFDIRQRDGFSGVTALLPRLAKPGVVLIDPPYDNHQDYLMVSSLLIDAQQNLTDKIVLLWYPLLPTPLTHRLEKTLDDIGCNRLLRTELSIGQRERSGSLHTSAMVIINVPDNVKLQLERVLPFLVEVLAQGQESWCLRP
ncbi:23S rRNA (adenine(2030)-N(6))-methyltransferase RlmJ [Kaarinaea lacus]